MQLKKAMVVFLLYCSSICICQDTPMQTVVERVYGFVGVGLPSHIQRSIMQLFNQLEQSSSYVKYQISTYVDKMLRQSFIDIEKQIAAYHQNQKKIPKDLIFYRFCLNAMISHMYTYRQSFSIISRVLFQIKKISRRFFYSIGLINEPADQKISVLAQKVYNYLMLEIDEILISYQKVLTFLHARINVDLPRMLDVWGTSELQEQLKMRSEHFDSQPKIQMAAATSVMGAIAAQAGVFGGIGLSVQWVDKIDQETYKKLAQKQQKITTKWEQYSKKISQQQTKALKVLKDTFSQSQKELREKYKLSSTRMQQSILYMQQSINLDQPKTRYLVSPIEWDRYFSIAKMYTPASSTYPWFDIFSNFNGAQWVFEPTSQNFSQINEVAIEQPYFWQVKNRKNTIRNDPGSFSIFTEWVTGKKTYTIEVDCYLYSYKKPFFLGVLCNRGRWISGDPERLWWYRVACLYTSDQQKNSAYVGFAQQKINLSTSQKQEESIISPLEQVLTRDKNEQEISLADIKLPAHLVFTIITEPRQVDVKIEHIESDGSKIILYNQKINQLSDYIYKYHGVGFLAAGCTAQFHINQPRDLTYDEDEVARFLKKI